MRGRTIGAMTTDAKPTTSSSRSTGSPDTAGADTDSYVRVHRALRHSAGQFADAVARPTAAIAPLHRWYRGFADEIRCHHHIEDELLFPALADRVATYVEHESTLVGDHAELDVLLDELDNALDRDDRAVAIRLSRGLSDHLHHHLDYEDDEIVPLFARHFTSDEFEALNQRAIRMTPPRQLIFTAPWMMSLLTPAEQSAVLASSPKAMRVLWLLTRGRYARIERRAFGR